MNSNDTSKEPEQLPRASSWWERNRPTVHKIIRAMLIITIIFVIGNGLYHEFYDDDICDTDEEFINIINHSESLKKITDELEPEHRARYLRSLRVIFKGNPPSTFMQYYNNIRASLLTALLSSYLLTGELHEHSTVAKKTVAVAVLNTMLTS
jgi:hypothetical protein